MSAQIWADGEWIRTDTTLPSGTVEHSVVVHDKLWLWYNNDERVFYAPAGDSTADLMQHLPTYEDVLALDKSEITQADYVERAGQPCIYVEASQKELGYLQRYWISTGNGLLMAAETECDGVVIYSMASREVVSPLNDASQYFVLPDGTNLLNPL